MAATKIKHTERLMANAAAFNDANKEGKLWRITTGEAVGLCHVTHRRTVLLVRAGSVEQLFKLVGPVLEAGKLLLRRRGRFWRRCAGVFRKRHPTIVAQHAVWRKVSRNKERHAAFRWSARRHQSRCRR